MTDTADNSTTAETLATTESTTATADIKMDTSAAGGDQTEKLSEETTESLEKKTDDSTETNGKSESIATTSSASGEGEESPPKLFVGRLPVGTKDTQLKELFGTYGEVTHCDIVGKYGFVHMKNKDEANNAMTKLNNHSFNGSNITVQLSTSTSKKNKKKQQRKKFDGKQSSNGNNNNSPNRRSSNMKNGVLQNKNKTNNNSSGNSASNNANQANPRRSLNNNNNRTNGNSSNKMNRSTGIRKSFQQLRMSRPLVPPPQLSQMGGYYNQPPPPMNSYYQQQPPMPAPQMAPVNGPPRDMYAGYSRPLDNGQYGGYAARSNGGPSGPPQMFTGMQPQMHHHHQPTIQTQPPPPMHTNYYQSTYSRGPSSMSGINKMNALQSPPPSVAPQSSMYGQGYGMNPMSTPSPVGPPVGNAGYGQMMNAGGYGNGQMMNTNASNNNFLHRNGFANHKMRSNSNNRFNNTRGNNKRTKLN